MGRIEAICSSDATGEKKAPVDPARFVVDHGIEGDAHAGSWHRQVSMLAAEDVALMRERGLPDLRAGDFAENLVVEGVDLAQLGLGSRLRLGESVELSVTQLGKVCHHRCAIYRQTGDCIMPRLGLFSRVTSGGTLRAGDPIHVSEAVPRSTFQCVVLTISDRCSRGVAEDTAGPAVVERLESRLGAHVYRTEVIPDRRQRIADRLRHYANGHSIDLILCVGGTGFAPRDVTPEAISDVIERPTPGLDQVMRMSSLSKTANAMLSRALSGISASTLIMSLPGSRRAALDNLDAVLAALAHGLAKLRGDPSDCGRESS
jgi:molybdenum cofactor synthesis domain-containing protein